MMITPDTKPHFFKHPNRLAGLLSIALLNTALLSGCGAAQHSALDTGAAPSAPFQIAVIPDTQNALNYKHQTAAGFAIDSQQLFLEQMRYIAEHAQGNGGDIAFVAAVGDVWQHQSEKMDPAHAERGFEAIANPYFAVEVATTDKVLSDEIPRALEGYQLLSDAGLPFGVAPGNHDYDAMWSVAKFPPKLNQKPGTLRRLPEDLGMLHMGGLNNFRSVFGDQQAFFKDKDWYIDSFNGGANSAQLFNGGGYQFLHLTLEMQPSNQVIGWAEKVIKQYPGLPTIITIHDFLNTQGERLPNPIVDLARVDPDQHNSSEQLWQKLISQHDQIFMLICGHQHGQALRIDDNSAGHKVYQILADYQNRGQVALDKGQALHPYTRKPYGTGDGWFRLMRFDLSSAQPSVKITTYSSHLNASSAEVANYASWYKRYEQPQMSDAQFKEADDFTLPLEDFHQRFGLPSSH